MSYLCTCPGKGSFKNADGSVRCATCASPEEVEAELVRLQTENDALRAAGGALVDALPFDVSVCPKCRGNVLATKVCRFEPPYAGSWFACDEHATPGAMDMRMAPAVRALRALLGGS